AAPLFVIRYPLFRRQARILHRTARAGLGALGRRLVLLLAMAHVAGCSNADRTGAASEPAPAPGTQPAADSAQAAGPAVDESAAASRAGAVEAAAGAGVDRAHSSAGAALRPTPGAIRSDVLIV